VQKVGPLLLPPVSARGRAAAGVPARGAARRSLDLEPTGSPEVPLVTGFVSPLISSRKVVGIVGERARTGATMTAQSVAAHRSIRRYRRRKGPRLGV